MILVDKRILVLGLGAIASLLVIRGYGSASLAELIPGGRSSGHRPSEFGRDQLRMGIEIEMEHTGNKRLAQEIAMDHLVEDPKYYTKLKRAGL